MNTERQQLTTQGKKSDLALSSSEQCSPPQLVRVALGILTPRAIEEDFIADFDEIYKNWAIPAYGPRAPLWAWGQVLKTAAVILRDTALEFWGKAKRRAR